MVVKTGLRSCMAVFAAAAAGASEAAAGCAGEGAGAPRLAAGRGFAVDISPEP